MSSQPPPAPDRWPSPARILPIALENVRQNYLAAWYAGGYPEVAGASYFEAQSEQGVIRGLASFVSQGGQTFGIIGMTPAEGLAAHDAAFRQTIGSFGPLTDPAALAVQPARVELVKVPRQMSVAEFHAQFPSTVPVEQVAIMNGVDPASGTCAAGRTVKRVVGGVPAGSPAAPR